MESVIETKASMILQVFDGLRGDLHVTFEEVTSAAWLYDLLKPDVTKLARLRARHLPSILVCDVLCARHLVAHGPRAPEFLANVSSDQRSP
jgi:hypothetical protein